MNVYLKIKNCENVSETMKGVSKFILQHPKEVIDMTISELAKCTYVSAATIVRYSYLFGYDGFKAFKLALASDLNEFLCLENIQNEEILSRSPFLSFEEVSDYYYNSSIVALKKQYKYIDKQAIEQIVNDILKVDKINIWGVGSSLLEAKDFTFRLRKVGIHAYTETLIGYDDTAFKIAKDCEMNIIISQSLENTQMLQWVNNFIAMDRSFTIITSNNHSEYLNKADNYILYGDYDINLKMRDPFMNRVCLHFVLDTIIGLIYTRHYSQSLKSLTEYKIVIREEQNRFFDSKRIKIT